MVSQHFQTAVSSRKSIIQQEWNSLARIHQLPVEIFTRILAASVEKDMDLSSGEDEGDVTERLEELCGVSKHWRGVLLGTPQLWTTIRLGARSVALTEVAIERSQGLPLHIIYYYSRSRRREPLAEDLFRMVAPHCHRWKSLRWRGAAGALERILDDFPSPSLEVLDLNTAAMYDEGPIHYTLPPRLRSLRLDGVLFPWPPEGLSQLTSFSLEGLPSDDLHSPAELLAFSAACPLLQHISFSALGYSRDTPTLPLAIPVTDPILILPSLLSISFERCTETLVASFLHVVSAPKLKSLSLETGFHRDLADEALIYALISSRDRDSPLRSVRRNVPNGEIYVGISQQSVQLIQYDPEGDEPNGIYISMPHERWVRNIGRLVTTAGLPTSLYIRQHQDDQEFDTTSNPFETTLRADWMSEMTHIYVTNYLDLGPVLQALSTAITSQDDTAVAWPCPSLEELHLSQTEFPEISRPVIFGQIRTLLGRRSAVQVYDGANKRYDEGVGLFMEVATELA